MFTYMCARKVGFSLLHVDNYCGHVVKVRRFRAYVFDNMSWTYVYAFARQTVLPLCHMIWSLFDIFVPIDMKIRHLLYMSTYIPSVPASCFLRWPALNCLHDGIRQALPSRFPPSRCLQNDAQNKKAFAVPLFCLGFAYKSFDENN